VTGDSNKVKVLVLNAGSSSIKSCVYELEHGEDNKPHVEPIWKGQGRLKRRSGEADRQSRCEVTSIVEFKNENIDSGFARLFQELTTHPPTNSGTGRDTCGWSSSRAWWREVFRGHQDRRSVIQDLNNLIDLAPSHMPSNLKGIEVAKEHFPTSVQIAIFDTAFHSTMPDEAIIYATPWEWYQERLIRRYGFHGISHAFCLSQAALPDEERNRRDDNDQLSLGQRRVALRNQSGRVCNEHYGVHATGRSRHGHSQRLD